MGSLLDEIDQTITPMGGRLLRLVAGPPADCAGRSAIGSTRSRNWPFAAWSALKLRDASSQCTTSNGWWRGLR